MKFTRVKIYKILEEQLTTGCEIEEIFKMNLEILMRQEREVHNLSHKDQSNGYRSGSIPKVCNPKTFTYNKGRHIGLHLQITVLSINHR